MASFGRVLDLLENRYLKLQDVTGNVEPLPTLVPYDKYAQNVIVYRMDTTHEVFMDMVQDFTMRMSQQLGKELWTWCVQWDVDQDGEHAPSPKKPRLEAAHAEDDREEQQTTASKPIIDIFDRCVLDPELMQQEELLRILINIVQAESSIVPNLVEILYRWIDFYKGDGTALRAAMKWEIPSLWDFEYHPLVLPEDVKKKMVEVKARLEKEKAALRASEQKVPSSKATEPSSIEELVHGSPTTRMREKPLLAAMEHQVEESERLKYREVKYGIQPPKTNRPMPPLINIPLEPVKRVKYYDACFRSRHRALVLLLEAGISLPQISNYIKGQDAHPRDTPEDGDPKEPRGLRHYHKDAEAAQDYFKIREKIKSQREKQHEIAISTKLAVEAQRAVNTSAPEGSPGVPLIPPTPSYDRRPDMAANMWSRIQAARAKAEECINFVPTPLVGGMKSKLLRSARDKPRFQGGGQPGPHQSPSLPLHGAGDNEESDSEKYDGSRSGSNSDDSSDDEDDGLNGNPAPPSTQGASAPRPFLPPTPFSSIPVSGQPQNQHPAGPAATEASILRSPPSPAAMLEYMRNMTPEHAQRILPMLPQRMQQGVANMVASQTALSQVPRPAIAVNGPSGQASSSMLSTANTGTAVGGHVSAHLAAMGFLPPPVQPPMPGQPRSMLHMLPSQVHPRGPIMSPNLGASGQHFSQPQMSSETLSRPPIPSGFPLNSQTRPLPAQSTSRSSGGLRAFPGPPQIARPQQITLPTPSMPQVPQLPTLPSVPHLVSTAPTTVSPIDIQLSHLMASGAQQSPNESSPLPPPSSGRLFNIDQFLMLQRQQAAQAQVPHQQQQVAQLTNIISSSQPSRPPQQQHPIAGNNDHPNQFQGLSWPNAVLPPLPQPTPPAIRVTAPQFQPQQPGIPTLAAPLPSIQRNAPSPLNLQLPSSNPLSSLANSILATTPFRASAAGVPIQMYFPKIVLPANGIGPGGTRLGDNHHIETDAFLLGHTIPGSGKITLERALFMPLGCWTNCLNRVRKGHYQVLETYMSPFNPFTGHHTNKHIPCHAAAYTKLAQAYDLMKTSSPAARERELTKRWRASHGPMTQRDRGAVWEGWGVTLDRGIEMVSVEREGVMVSSRVVDDGVERRRSGVEEERWREMERLMEEDEADDEDMEE